MVGLNLQYFLKGMNIWFIILGGWPMNLRKAQSLGVRILSVNLDRNWVPMSWGDTLLGTNILIYPKAYPGRKSLYTNISLLWKGCSLSFPGYLRALEGNPDWSMSWSSFFFEDLGHFEGYFEVVKTPESAFFQACASGKMPNKTIDAVCPKFN